MLIARRRESHRKASDRLSWMELATRAGFLAQFVETKVGVRRMDFRFVKEADQIRPAHAEI